MEYRVVRPFKYGGRQLEIGDAWEPNDGKWDDSIKTHFVQPVEDAPKKRGRRSTKKDD